MECTICYEPHPCLNCPKVPARLAPSHTLTPQCAHATCTTCIGKYIDTVSVAKCPSPSCDQLWSREFFATGGRPLVTRYDALLRRNAIDDSRLRLPVVQTILSNKRRLAALDEEITTARARIESATSERKRLREENATLEATSAKASSASSIAVFCKCPIGACTGLIAEATMTCALCATAVCRDCLAPKAPEHTCAPDAIMSAQEIRKTTRPCPKCATSIFRISGCDQMWCTLCKTPFSWATGKVDTGNVHNPHFFEWKQRAQQQGIAGAAACEERIQVPAIRSDRIFIDVFNALSPITPANYRAYLKAVSTLHLAAELVNRTPTTRRPNTLPLHLKAAAGDIDEETLAKRVVAAVSKTEKIAEKRCIAGVLFAGARSVCQRAEGLSPDDIELEIDSLVAFYNESLRAIVARYGGREADIRFCLEPPSDDPATRTAFASATTATAASTAVHPSARFDRYHNISVLAGAAAAAKSSCPVLVDVSGRIATAYYMF